VVRQNDQEIVGELGTLGGGFLQPEDRLPAIVRESVADQVAYADDQFGFVETLPGAGQIQLGCFSFVAWQAAFALFIYASQGVFGGAVSLGGG